MIEERTKQPLPCQAVGEALFYHDRQSARDVVEYVYSTSRVAVKSAGWAKKKRHSGLTRTLPLVILRNTLE
jgi:hypothetical protein